MVELIPKKKKRPPFGKLFFAFVSIILFVSVIFGFFIFQSRKSDAQESLDALTAQLQLLIGSQQEEVERELFRAQVKISDFAFVLKERADYLVLFDLLENTTHPKVVLLDFKKDSENEEISLTGTAPSFKILEQQRLVWEDEDRIENVSLDIGLGSGLGVNFTVELSVSPRLTLPYMLEETDPPAPNESSEPAGEKE